MKIVAAIKKTLLGSCYALVFESLIYFVFMLFQLLKNVFSKKESGFEHSVVLYITFAHAVCFMFVSLYVLE